MIKFIYIYLFLFSFNVFALSKKDIKIGVSFQKDTPEFNFVVGLINFLNKEYPNHKFSLIILPNAQIQKKLKEQKIDIDLGRISNIYKDFSYIKESRIYTSQKIFQIQKEEKKCESTALLRYSEAIKNILVQKFNIDIIFIDNIEQGIKLLDIDRIDCLFTISIQKENYLKKIKHKIKINEIMSVDIRFYYIDKYNDSLYDTLDLKFKEFFDDNKI